MIEELKKSDKTRQRSRKEAKENSKAKENSIVGKSDLEKPEKTSPKKMSDNPVKTTENTKTTDKQPKINEVLQSKNASQTQNNNKKEITVGLYQDIVGFKRADATVVFSHLVLNFQTTNRYKLITPDWYIVETWLYSLKMTARD